MTTIDAQTFSNLHPSLPLEDEGVGGWMSIPELHENYEDNCCADFFIFSIRPTLPRDEDGVGDGGEEGSVGVCPVAS